MSLKIKFFICIIFLGLTMASISSAQGVIPCGQGNDPSNACTLCHFIVGINNIVKYGATILISVSAVAIFISGIMYIVSSGNEQAMTAAKGFLGSALKGFAIVLGAWLIVNVTMWVFSYNTSVIDKVNWYTFSCNTKSSTSGPIGAITYPENALADAKARQQLSAAGIGVSSSGNCSDQNNSKCTSLEGIPEVTIQGVIAIKNTCGITPTITGGTETGHASHGTGKTPVDLSWNKNLAACIQKNASSLGVKQICTTSADAQYRLNCGTNESVEHIHIAF